jgi:hypothetical protein
MEQIIIWESNIERIHACETAVYKALKELGLKARVTVNSETPLISRNQLWERLPVLEIRDQRWSLHPGVAFTSDQLTRLFRKIFSNEISTSRDSIEGDHQGKIPIETVSEGETNGS